MTVDVREDEETSGALVVSGHDVATLEDSMIESNVTEEYCTPELAAKWMGANGSRKLSQARIDMFAGVLVTAQREGRQDGIRSSTPVETDEAGKVVDGHHRLAAIVQSGIGSTVRVKRSGGDK